MQLACVVFDVICFRADTVDADSGGETMFPRAKGGKISVHPGLELHGAFATLLSPMWCTSPLRDAGSSRFCIWNQATFGCGIRIDDGSSSTALSS